MLAPSPSERVAIITGAAGGLGQALVTAFSDLHWRVVAASRGSAPATESDRLWPVALNVTNQSEARNLVEQVLARWERIDVLVNNAGAIADAPLWQVDDAAWEKVLSANLKGAFICSQMVLRPMLRQRDGHIVNISSFSGRVGAAGQTSYAAAKAGLFGLTASLAQEVGSRNIRVNAVLPGILPTRMTSHLDSRQMEEFANANALKRINSVGEVARFIAFLVTTQNISGQIFQLDSRVAPWT